MLVLRAGPPPSQKSSRNGTNRGPTPRQHRKMHSQFKTKQNKTKTISRRASTPIHRGTLTTSIGTGTHKISDARTSTNTQHTHKQPQCAENTAGINARSRHEANSLASDGFAVETAPSSPHKCQIESQSSEQRPLILAEERGRTFQCLLHAKCEQNSP